MTRVALVILLGLIVFVRGSINSEQHPPGVGGQQWTPMCTYQAVQSCVGWFVVKYADEFKAAYPYHTMETMTQICNDFALVESCFKPLKPTCNPNDVYTFEGLEDAYTYICSAEGLQLYNQHRDCFAKTEVQSGCLACNVTFQSRATALGQQFNQAGSDSARAAVQHQYCNTINDYLRCVHGSVEASCGSEAASWQETVDSKKLTPMLIQYDCHIAIGDLSAGAKAGIVIGSIVGFIILVAFIIIIVCYLRSRHDRKKPPTAKQYMLTSQDSTTSHDMSRASRFSDRSLVVEHVSAA